MNGSVFKRYPCPGKHDGKGNSQTCKKPHGSWYFIHDPPTDGKRRPQVKRGGFATKPEAEAELTKSMHRYGQRGIAAERNLKAGRQHVGDYLRAWGEGKAGLKASTRRSYRTHIDNYLVPLLGGLRLDELGTGHIEAAYQLMRQSRTRAPRRKRHRAGGAVCADGRPRLGWGELPPLVLAHLAAQPGCAFTAHEVAVALDRSPEAAACALRRLARDGHAELRCTKPRRYAAIPRAEAAQATADPATWRLSPATVQRVHATLRKALNDAVKQRILDYNPAVYADLEPVRTPRAKWWTPQDAGRFLDAIVEDRLYALYHLAVYRGPRRGEILALRWPGIDLDEGFIEISRNIVQLGYATEEGTPKSAESERVIALDDDTIAVLRAHRARQDAERLRLGRAYRDDGLVFAKEDGSPLHPEYVSRHLRVLIKRARVPAITFHQLRHTAASLMLEAGYELKYVQHVLGHSSITITAKLYLHITRRLDQRRSGQVARLVPRSRLLPPDADGEMTQVA